MKFKEILSILEALTPQQQKDADMRKAAIAKAKQKDASLRAVPDEDFEYDPLTNTVRKMRLTTSDLNKIKTAKVVK